MNRTLFLEPHQEVKVGRSVARNRVSENNAIFDCKVLSRNHAVLWYNDGKFFIKDTGSSNGTFINNVRLSQTSTESEPYEGQLRADFVQFGVDVMENTRRETHGCIVATLKLFLPDGRETKASQSIGVGGQSTKIPPVDLQNSALGWQAMIDEDRLLSRIDMLEKKLQYFQKGMTDDKLREEVLKLQDEKYQYQNSAKETLWKVHQERLDATHKLTAIEKALCSSEDECSFLREQLSKTQLQLQEVTGRLDALQNQYDERVSAGEEQLKAKESEVSNLSHEINLLQEKISFYAFYASDEDDQQQQQQEYNNSAVSDWLLKSDIKKLEGSEDIIKAICNDAEADANSDEKEINLEDSVMQLQKRIMTLERNISLFMENDSRVENENNEPNDNASVTSTSTTNTTVPGAVSNDNAADPPTIADGEECDGNQNVQNATGESDSQPSTNETTTTTTTTAAATIANSNADQPQQNPPKRSSSGTKLPAHLSCELNQNVLRRNLKHIKSECALLLRQVSKVREDNRKSDDSVVAKVKYDELEGELRTLKQELESRPRSDELDKKQQQCDSLSENLATLRIEADELRALNDRCQDEMERMENELLKQKNIENEKHSAMAALHKQEAFSVEEVVAVGKAEVEAVPTKAIEVASVETQTEVEEPAVLSADVSESDVSICSNLGELDEDDDDDEEDDDEKTETIDTTEIFVGQKLLQLNESGLETTDSATSNSHSISISSSPNDSNLSLEGETTPVTVTGGGEPNGSILERVENLPLESSSIEHELELINHPDVQREEELIAFKEKYTHLTQENIRLNQQLQKLSDDFSHFKSKSVMNLLMYIAPVIVIIGYLLFNRVVS
ncbi:tropomyosin [Culex quinquefasciatus]|uniref:Tropomyosin n=1 Tax=Culex quinquefasciatus TaxID=7176 RepID=B0XHH1_CULQU|nr:tropomyosin [Culex quinquefasciatus]|eukprot:XP_001869093.1 tropomyosin [Culex quinquefasciatus]